MLIGYSSILWNNKVYDLGTVLSAWLRTTVREWSPKTLKWHCQFFSKTRNNLLSPSGFRRLSEDCGGIHSVDCGGSTHFYREAPLLLSVGFLICRGFLEKKMYVCISHSKWHWIFSLKENIMNAFGCILNTSLINFVKWVRH